MIDVNSVNVSIEELQKVKLFVGTPMYGGLCHGLFAKGMGDLSAICAANKISMRPYYLFNESLVQRARNYVADAFLRSDATHLLFIDADISFDAKSVIMLLSLQLTYPDIFNVMCAPYTKKSISWDRVAKAAKADKNPADLHKFAGDFVLNLLPGTTSVTLNKPFEVSEAGTGFMLIPREVLVKYIEEYPELRYKPDHLSSEDFNGSRDITAFFHCVIDPDTNRYLSEDYFFCKQIRKIGFSIWMCPWIELKHCGSYIFDGTMQGLAELETITSKPNKSAKLRNKQTRK